MLFFFYKCIIPPAQCISVVVCRHMRIHWASNHAFAGETDYDGWPREISQSSTSSYSWNQRQWELERKAPKRNRFQGQFSCLSVLKSAEPLVRANSGCHIAECFRWKSDLRSLTTGCCYYCAKFCPSRRWQSAKWILYFKSSKRKSLCVVFERSC